MMEYYDKIQGPDGVWRELRDNEAQGNIGKLFDEIATVTNTDILDKSDSISSSRVVAFGIVQLAKGDIINIDLTLDPAPSNATFGLRKPDGTSISSKATGGLARATSKTEIPNDGQYEVWIWVPSATSYTIHAYKAYAATDIDKRFDAVDHTIDNLNKLYNYTVDPGAMIDGQFIYKNGAQDTLTSCSCTGHIPVIGGMTIKVSNVYLVGNASVCAYNADRRMVGLLGQGTTATEITAKIPDDAVSIRATCKLGEKPVLIYTDYPINTALEALKIENTLPLSKACAHMTVTVIDDDTDTMEQVQLFHEKCEAAGIKGTYACITAHSIDHPEIKAALRQYQSEGYGLAYHCHSQIDAYDAGTRDFPAAQANFVQGLLEMRELGFITNCWVNPYGVSDDEIQTLAKKYGLSCMATVNQGYESKESDNRFAIKRTSLYTERVNETYAQQDPLNPQWWQYDFAKLKTLVDSCAAENGWLLICTHMWGGGRTYWPESNRLTEFVEYVKSVAPTAKFLTLDEAFCEREPIYRLHEMT